MEKQVIISERMGIDVSPQQRIEDMIRVTEFCIDLLKENEEHHGEVGKNRKNLPVLSTKIR